jgi:hypothetical protein
LWVWGRSNVAITFSFSIPALFIEILRIKNNRKFCIH